MCGRQTHNVSFVAMWTWLFPGSCIFHSHFILEASDRHQHSACNMVPVLTACQPTENGVLAWMTYMVMGLWLSGPGLQESWAVVSVISSIVTASGGPGGPGREQVIQNRRDTQVSKYIIHWLELGADSVNHLFTYLHIYPIISFEKLVGN